MHTRVRYGYGFQTVVVVQNSRVQASNRGSMLLATKMILRSRPIPMAEKNHSRTSSHGRDFDHYKINLNRAGNRGNASYIAEVALYSRTLE